MDTGPPERAMKDEGSSWSGRRGKGGVPKKKMQKTRDTRAFGLFPQWLWDQVSPEDKINNQGHRNGEWFQKASEVSEKVVWA